MPASEGQENDLSPKIYLLPSSATITIYIATEKARLPGEGKQFTCFHICFYSNLRDEKHGLKDNALAAPLRWRADGGGGGGGVRYLASLVIFVSG